MVLHKGYFYAKIKQKRIGVSMQPLKVLIDCLSAHRNIHINVLDLNGILQTEGAALPFEDTIHSKKFCDVAKSTVKGYRACLRCKQCATDKAVCEKTPFHGMCFFGVYEAVVPVIIQESVVAVVYVGNAVCDDYKTRLRMQKACRRTAVSEQELLLALSQCEIVSDPLELLQIGEIVADYIKALCKNVTDQIKTKEHWIVTSMKQYAEQQFSFPISLKEFAKTYRKNEKYVGRLFKKETGKSFAEYCNDLRLERSIRLLSQEASSIINIALECGFNNISYFNRVFRKKYGVSPTAYKVGANKKR